MRRAPDEEELRAAGVNVLIGCTCVATRRSMRSVYMRQYDPSLASHVSAASASAAT